MEGKMPARTSESSIHHGQTLGGQKMDFQSAGELRTGYKDQRTEHRKQEAQALMMEYSCGRT
jgi:hypothetical protein